MAHTKTGGAVAGNKDSIGKRLGVKKFGGQSAVPGNIILRQRGSSVRPGTGVRVGRDYTIYAVDSGTVTFHRRLGRLHVSVQ